MRRLLITLLLLGPLSLFAAGTEKGRLIKVLPLFLDAQGHDALSPSLFDRDAYQAQLRRHADQRAAIRFDLLWQVKNPSGTNYTLRVELRGVARDGKPTRLTVEQQTPPRQVRHWNSLTLGGEGYKNLGDLIAWRATLRNGDQLLSEQKSFLW